MDLYADTYLWCAAFVLSVWFTELGLIGFESTFAYQA